MNPLVSSGFSHQDIVQTGSIIKLYIVINIKFDQYGGKKNIFLAKSPSPNMYVYVCGYRQVPLSPDICWGLHISLEFEKFGLLGDMA